MATLLEKALAANVSIKGAKRLQPDELELLVAVLTDKIRRSQIQAALQRNNIDAWIGSRILIAVRGGQIKLVVDNG